VVVVEEADQTGCWTSTIVCASTMLDSSMILIAKYKNIFFMFN
jgi:hypothetical protein